MLAFSAPTWKTGITPGATVTVEKLRDAAHRADEIAPRLYLSDYATATNRKALVSLRITHVVSCIGGPPEFPKGLKLQTLHIPVEDLPFVDLLVHFDATNAFIGKALENPDAVVLVHCLMGMSRRASVVCAHLIATRRLSAPAAVAFVKARRRIVRPNTGFMRQLELFAARHGHPAPGPPPERDALAALLARDAVAGSVPGAERAGVAGAVQVAQGDVLSEGLPADALVVVEEEPAASEAAPAPAPAAVSVPPPKGIRIAGLIRRYMANASTSGAAKAASGKAPSSVR